MTAAVTNTILILQPGQCVFHVSGLGQFMWLYKLQLVIFANSGLLLLQELSSNISVWDS